LRQWKTVFASNARCYFPLSGFPRAIILSAFFARRTYAVTAGEEIARIFPLKTSRSQVDRILDPRRDITPGSLQRAAALVGQRVVIELV
jgi:hypothetical protein